MRKLRLILAFVLSCLLLVSCGVQESVGNGQQEGSEYLDIISESEQFYNVAEEKGMMRGKYLGMQFYKQEPVQIWAEKKSPESSYGSGGIYVYKEDGSSELLLENFSQADDFMDCYIGTDGYYYFWSPVTFEKMDQSGEVLFSFSPRDLDIGISDICQLSDGRLFMIISNGNSMEKNPTELVEMDTATGEITKIDTISRTDISSIRAGGIAAGPDGLMIMTSEGIWTLNVEDGSKTSILSFVGSSYRLSAFDIVVEDFQVTEDRKVEILQRPGSGADRNTGYVETLELADVSKEKVPITIRGMNLTKYLIGDWLKDQIIRFNQKSDTYHVVLQECEPETDSADYARQTSVEIATGKGPDILLGQVLEDYIYGMIEKGAFEDLNPYLESSGIKEDCFPCAFNCWQDGDKIYGVNFWTDVDGYQIEEAVLGTRDVPDIETLADALLNWQEDAVYMLSYDSAEVLRHFLEGSENLWGMIDWEDGSCDFKGELFAKLVEAAKRYGYDKRNNYPALVNKRHCDDFVFYDSQAMQIETGKVNSGVLFDDGCYGAVNTDYILAVNSNSSNIEGAWEFISYLLGTEAQSTFHYTDALPVNREAFDILAEKPTDRGMTYFKNGVEYFKASASEVEEMIEFIEKAKPLPIRTVPILDIICEEAADYFDGTKSLEEVIAVIENRVSLYLEENK